MKFINPLNGREETELTHEIFEELYLNSRPNVDINTLFKHDCNFRMPDRLSRVHFKRTIKQTDLGRTVSVEIENSPNKNV